MELAKKIEYIPYEKLTKGMYYDDRKNIVKVQKSRTSGMYYALILNTNTMRFEYAKGLAFRLVERMPLDEALAFGKLTSHCCVCGLTLTNAKSVELGIGPICRGYF